MNAVTAVEMLDQIASDYSYDPERAHSEADDVQRQLVPDEVSDAYQRVVDACRWWACA